MSHDCDLSSSFVPRRLLLYRGDICCCTSIQYFPVDIVRSHPRQTSDTVQSPDPGPELSTQSVSPREPFILEGKFSHPSHQSSPVRSPIFRRGMHPARLSKKYHTLMVPFLPCPTICAPSSAHPKLSLIPLLLSYQRQI